MTTVLSPVALALYLHPYWFMWVGVATPDAPLYPNRAALVTYGLAFDLGWAVHRQASTVLARYADAVGSVESIRTRRTTMRVSGMAPFEILVPVATMRPNQLRKEVTIQGSVRITAYDGTDAWRIDPFVPVGNRPMNVPAPELPDLIDVAGKRVAVHSLAVTQRDGRESVIHLDASSLHEVQRVQTRPAMDRGIRDHDHDVRLSQDPRDRRPTRDRDPAKGPADAYPGRHRPRRVRRAAAGKAVQLERRNLKRGGWCRARAAGSVGRSRSTMCSARRPAHVETIDDEGEGGARVGPLPRLQDAAVVVDGGFGAEAADDSEGGHGQGFLW